uniref:Uncharacterized protein n=1 Tax=Acrobeloides nanus TaxID=290746 RepID=A0A914DPM3_9BILA
MTSITLPLTWLPVGLYVLLCLHLIICFNWAYKDLLKCDLTEEQLVYGHEKYLKAITLTNLVDSVYAYVVFYEVTLTTLNTMFGIYGIIKLFPHSPSALFTSEYFGQKDDFLLLLKDRDWPLSYGHFVVLERNFLLTMIGLVVSALIIWIEFGKDASFECALFNELQKNNTNSLTMLHCPTI